MESLGMGRSFFFVVEEEEAGLKELKVTIRGKVSVFSRQWRLRLGQVSTGAIAD